MTRATEFLNAGLTESCAPSDTDSDDLEIIAAASPVGSLYDQAGTLGKFVMSLPSTVLNMITPTQLNMSPTSPSSSSVVSEGPRPNRPRRSPASALKARPKIPFGFSFAPAGLLFPYHLGVATYLQHIGYITEHTPLMGSSAGALVTVCMALRLSAEKVWKMLYNLETQFTLRGTRGKMRRHVKRGLEEILPDDAHTILNARAQPSFIIYTAVKGPLLKARYCSQFESKQDLIKCLLASCNIPMYFTNKPFISVRSDWAVDGYFSDVRSFGCPPFQPYANVVRQVRVMPFEASKILAGAPTSPEEAGRCFPTEDVDRPPRLDYIAPDLCYYDHLIPEAELAKYIEYVNNNRALTPEQVQEKRLVLPSGPRTASDHPLYTGKSVVVADVDDENVVEVPGRFGACHPRKTSQGSHNEELVTRESIELPHVQTPPHAQPASIEVERRATEPGIAMLPRGSGEIPRLPSLSNRKSFEEALADQYEKNAQTIERHDSSSKASCSSGESPPTAVDGNFFNLFLSPKKMWENMTARLMGETGDEEAKYGLDKVNPLHPWGMLTKRVASTPGTAGEERAPGQTRTATELPFCRFSWGRLLQLALRPAHESRVVVELFELGRADAFRWHQMILRNSADLESQADRALNSSKSAPNLPVRP